MIDIIHLKNMEKGNRKRKCNHSDPPKSCIVLGKKMFYPCRKHRIFMLWGPMIVRTAKRNLNLEELPEDVRERLDRKGLRCDLKAGDGFAEPVASNHHIPLLVKDIKDDLLKNPKEIPQYELLKNHFDQTIFDSCEFSKTTMTFSGNTTPKFSNCKFNQCDLKF